MKMTLEEAARILDPETSKDALDSYTYDPEYRFQVCKEACRIAAAALREKHAENEPFTLGELQNMDGEPVWIQCADIAVEVVIGYAFLLFYTALPNKYSFLDQNGNVDTYLGCDYGKTWLAYRRKPEVQ